MMTYRCQVACPHCVVEAGPHRREEVDLEEALRWVQQISAYRGGHIRALSLTGGEPFCVFEKLKRVAAVASSLGLVVTVVTNAYWAEDKRKAVETLRSIPGLDMIGISSDVYHQKLIPFERVKNAALAAKECNLSFRILVSTESETAPEYLAVIERLSEVAAPENISTVRTFLAGRALASMQSTKFELSETPCPCACDAAGAPVLFPDGRAVACVGALIGLRSWHPLTLGNLRETSLEEILDKAEQNPILHAIRIWGPRKLIAMVADSGPKAELPGRYIADSNCDLCYALFTNPRIVQYLDRLGQDQDFRRTTAYGRVYYLNEPEMVPHLKEGYCNASYDGPAPGKTN
jgi:pyruvate-formate lyase-activating enzyme